MNGTRSIFALVVALVAASCGTEVVGTVPTDDAGVTTTPDSAAPPAEDAGTPAVAEDAGTPPSVEDAGSPVVPAEEPPPPERCTLGDVRYIACVHGCIAETDSYFVCDPSGRWLCVVTDTCHASAPPAEDAGTPPPPATDSGSPATDAGSPPPAEDAGTDAGPAPSVEDAGPENRCRDLPATRSCATSCGGIGWQVCDPGTGEYGDCVVVIPGVCDAGSDAGHDAGPPACVPTTEVCDGRDNDCNGLVDDVTPRSCYTGATGTSGIGPCHSGVQFCSGGSWGSCLGQVAPAAEICGNAIDEDCNGVDAVCPAGGCSADPHLGMVCSVGVGACRRDGSYICRAGDAAATCSVTTAGSPTTEVCGNSIDEDCNGADLACSTIPPTGLDRYEFAIDNAAIDAVLGACPSGRVILFWDQTGNRHEGGAGSPTYTIELTDGAGGFRALSFRCGTSYALWPASELNHVARHNGWVTSIRVNGVELADSEALICSDPAGGFIRPMIPRSSGLYGTCP